MSNSNLNLNFAIPDVDWNDVGRSITRVCYIYAPFTL